ncbi:MAG: hypothetical protein ACYC57_08200 [Thermoleophilia bacterium]
MKVQELEDKVWAQDGVRIVVRAPADAKLGSYNFKNAAQATWSVTKFLKARINPILKGHEVSVIMGDGEEPHGRTLLSSIRDSYKGR